MAILNLLLMHLTGRYCVSLSFVLLSLCCDARTEGCASCVLWALFGVALGLGLRLGGWLDLARPTASLLCLVPWRLAVWLDCQSGGKTAALHKTLGSAWLWLGLKRDRRGQRDLLGKFAHDLGGRDYVALRSCQGGESLQELFVAIVLASVGLGQGLLGGGKVGG